jgi:formylglycine-generating enzyme required for sulfatase activity
MSAHLGDEQIRRLLSGTLSDDELVEAEAHLWQCPDCREALERRTEPTPDLPPLAAPRSKGRALLNAVPAVPGHAVLGATNGGELPARLGRYRITGMLGSGGFGIVYKGYDDELRREVAIKVPHRERIATPQDAETYLAEARILASLDHPQIVPVHDVGRAEDGLCFVVTKFIEGTDLAQKLKDTRLSLGESVELTATIADALHHAHKRGLVHRDVKPGNILLDTEGRPYLADFGLALSEEDYGKGGGLRGTPAYMSPEQANGEGHRVDGRSDIFSLGSVFYELLTGSRPFRGNTPTDIIIQISCDEPQPPRQVADAIPAELERICLKALAKKASERYTTAKDFADDLRVAGDGWRVAGKGGKTDPATRHPPPATLKVVPKGLRSFDGQDADFFLELLPGARDREGLPESIRFWRTRIEETDVDRTFSVGLLYGPSGCGKSSLVKAGLLPRLSNHVIAVYVEATAGETEVRLLNHLRKRCPALPDQLGLKETLAALRRGRGIAVGKKVLIILDQFEQWLHANKEVEHTDLVHSLRQCDGGRLQCIVMVRDNFWMAATRFLRELEVRLVEGQNSTPVDLFPLRHAEKVLAAFGRAFGVLPDNPGETSTQQKQFLERAVAGLAQEEGKVIPVRLALFAEMMKGRAWTPAALKAVGGTEGVGVTFLEETFSAATAPPEHRYHQKAARAALQILLPEIGSDIKGHMRSYGELLEASGYGSRPKDFDDLIRILDKEIRLITPTDPEGVEGSGWRVEGKEEAGPSSPSTLHPLPSTRYYQLTHDYLVPSLRDWLTRKQKETRRGRAELLLADRAAVWNARPENRQLPSLVQWLQIKGLTAKQCWTPSQRQMMRKASRYHAVRGVAVAVLLAVTTFLGLTLRDRVEEQRKATYAAGLVQSLLNADTAQVPAIIAEMSAYRQWTDPLLREERDKAAATSRPKLHTSLALLPVDPGQVEYLSTRLLDAQPHEVPVIRDALALHKDSLLNKLWAVVAAPEKGKESQRLRAAAALGKYDPESEKWAAAQEAVGNDLVAVPALHLFLWMESLRPVRTKLLPQLSAVYRHAGRRETERSLATDILADYAADNPQVLADLLMDADDTQFTAIYPKLKDRSAQGLPLLTAEINRKLPSDLPSSDEKRETLAKRQANAAVALLRMNRPEKVWPLLAHSPDPRTRSYLIHRLHSLGADAGALLQRLDEEPDLTIRRALLMSLGEFNATEVQLASRPSLLPKVQTLYRTDADPGLHAAAEWLLRQWQQEAWLNQVNEQWAKDREQREKRLETIRQLLVPRPSPLAPPQWYVNTQGQTMVVIPGPLEFVMGSPTTEAGHLPNENQRTMRIGRIFALAAKSVRLAEYQRFDPAYGGDIKQWSPTGACPVVGISWFQAAAYCNWLSKQEGLPESEWCYVPLQDTRTMAVLAARSVGLLGSPLGPGLAVGGLYPGRTDPVYKVGMKLAANYLQRSGYRLPTEAEMEVATRAGAVTSRYYGETVELLEKYAWYQKNGRERSWPVGSKKPNDFGFFDVQGNVFTWCQERFQAHANVTGPGTADDTEDTLSVNTDGRGMRGGAFLDQTSNVRSADRNKNVPTDRFPYVGFRPARTLRLGSFSP